jgi:alpha-beta hydrolase superfamily lysophospholipase
MKSYSYSALTISAIAVSLCAVFVSAYLFFENVGNRWAYVAAIFVLAIGWIAQRLSDDRRNVQTSIVLAGLLLLVAMLEKLAHHAGWAVGADMDQRLFGVLLGAVVVALSNAIPKAAGSARALATRRVIGWALVLGGICYALAWLVLPLAIASDVAIISLLIGLAVGITAFARSWFAAVVVIAFACIAPSQAQSHEVSGPWHGTLKTSAGAFGLELLIQRRPDSTLSATLESIDQAPGEMLPANVTTTGDDVHVTMNSLGARFDGHVDQSGNAINGTWEQGASLPLVFERGPMPSVPTISGVDGTWRALLVRGATQLHLVLHVATSSHGTRATLDSPDMSLVGLQVSDLSRNADRIRFRVPIAQVAFDGSLDAQRQNIQGTWQRDGQAPAMVTFSREAPPSATPSPSHSADYRSESVHFANSPAHIVLAGTLTLPKNAVHAPAVVLISGSGPEDRDETIFGQKPFAVLADYLTRRGIIVLRYDDRGVGESTGTFPGATIEDFVGDARAAVAFLKSRREVDGRAICLIGHSQGGVVGPLVAMHNPTIAYLVLLAAPGTDMRELFLSQRRMAGLVGDELLLTQLYTAAAAAPDRASARARIAPMLTPRALSQLGVASKPKDTVVAQFTTDWLRSILRYNASATLRTLTIPILALNGSLDRQVAAHENLAAIRAATAANPAATARELPGLNHLFQPAHTGAIGEYAEIHEGFSPIALGVIGDWIKKSASTKK